MKKFKILILLMIIITSCSDTTTKTYSCHDSELIILNKKLRKSVGFNNSMNYSLYMYNGTTSIWYDTNEKTYCNHQIGDTLIGVTIK